MATVDAAVRAIEAGAVVVYPTETVYGLGADARSTAAIERVYTLKGRDRSDPLSVAVPAVDAVDRVARPTDETRRFMETFLPGPVTVVCPRRSSLPDALTAGRDRVGVRIPDHDLAAKLLERTPPLTATSANPSGAAEARELAELAPDIRAGAAVTLDGGRTGGVASTVVDVDRGLIHRRGARIEAVEAWLAERDDQLGSTRSP